MVGSDEKACCRLQIEVRVPELVSGPEMVTIESKMTEEELTEVTVKFKGVRGDLAVPKEVQQ